MTEEKSKKDLERRVIIPGRRECDQYCAMHDSIVASQEEIKSGFKWIIALHISHLLALIAGLFGIIAILISKSA